MKEKVYKIIFIIFLVLHGLLMVILGNNKVGYHYDEKLTFALANNENSMKGLDIVDGEQYSGYSLFEKYAAVEKKNTFNYKLVWKNQEGDVHPPLYYIIIHTICSFFPGKYTKWFGLVPNIICMMLIDCILYIGLKRAYRDEALALLVTVFSGLTLLHLNMSVFLRMYALLTVFVVAISMLYLNYRNSKLDMKYYILCYGIIVAGTMTQYYFLIYLFFLTLYFVVNRMLLKKWNEVIKFCLVVCAAGVSCVAVFPPIIHHIFGNEKRGGQAFEAIKTMQNYGAYLLEDINILNKNLLGNNIYLVILVCLILTILMTITRGKQVEVQYLKDSPKMILFAAVFYTLLIAKIAPYRTMRYLFPVGWGFILYVVWYVKIHLNLLLGDQKRNRGTVIISIVGTALLISSYYDANWQLKYDFKEQNYICDIAREYRKLPVLYVYKRKSLITCNAEELSLFSGYTFSRPQNLDDVLDTMPEKNVILYISGKFSEKEKEYIFEILEKHGISKKNMIHLYDEGYASSYLM